MKLCPFCNVEIQSSLVRHIKTEHGEEILREAVLSAKRQGMPDVQIGKKFGISFNYLERIITREYGTNISNVTRKRAKITRWQPKDFQPETATVWSFKNRGNWATHDGRYRGNWSPYIPRNLILRYSQPDDLVLDYFSGGGTTAVEAKLLGRRCIARDINPDALALTKENLDFQAPRELFSGNGASTVEPELILGDAKDLSSIPDESVDLICAHPPYAGIISYSADAVAGDLSNLAFPDFVTEMQQVARESFRVLKAGRQCAILIGDSRKSKHNVPIGFQTIRAFLNAGFLLRELIIKRQHNCKTTGFWYSNSIRYNFLLLAHEYLPIFEKPIAWQIAERRSFWETPLPHHALAQQARVVEEENFETTTVWVLPRGSFEPEIKRNLLRRFASAKGAFVEVEFHGESPDLGTMPGQNVSLVHVHGLKQRPDERSLMGYRTAVKQIAEHAGSLLAEGGFLVLETADFRIEKALWPMGLLLWEEMAEQKDFAIKDIVIVVPEEPPSAEQGEYLEVSHRYLLIYTRK